MLPFFFLLFFSHWTVKSTCHNKYAKHGSDLCIKGTKAHRTAAEGNLRPFHYFMKNYHDVKCCSWEAPDPSKASTFIADPVTRYYEVNLTAVQHQVLTFSRFLNVSPNPSSHRAARGHVTLRIMHVWVPIIIGWMQFWVVGRRGSFIPKKLSSWTSVRDPGGVRCVSHAAPPARRRGNLETSRRLFCLCLFYFFIF